MVNKLLVLLILVGILVNGCSPIEITEADKKYCEKDSDCGFQLDCCCYEAINKEFITDVTCDMKGIQCVPCFYSAERHSVKCVDNECKFVLKEEKIVKIGKNVDFPKSSQPYTSYELESITSIVDKNNYLNDQIIGEVFGFLQQEVKTFSGNQYIRFEPKLTLVRHYESSLELTFSGKGYISDDIYDNYHIRMRYKNNNAEILENAVAWKGVPDKYKQLAINIVKIKEPEIIEKTTTNPDVRWIPEQDGILSLLFVSPSTIPESPHAWIQIDLEKENIVSLEKKWWE